MVRNEGRLHDHDTADYLKDQYNVQTKLDRYYVVERIMIHALIPRTCEYVTLHGKRDLHI